MFHLYNWIFLTVVTNRIGFVLHLTFKQNVVRICRIKPFNLLRPGRHGICQRKLQPLNTGKIESYLFNIIYIKLYTFITYITFVIWLEQIKCLLRFTFLCQFLFLFILLFDLFHSGQRWRESFKRLLIDGTGRNEGWCFKRLFRNTSERDQDHKQNTKRKLLKTSRLVLEMKRSNPNRKKVSLTCSLTSITIYLTSGCLT